MGWLVRHLFHRPFFWCACSSAALISCFKVPSASTPQHTHETAAPHSSGPKPPFVAQARYLKNQCIGNNEFLLELSTHAYASRIAFTVHRFAQAVSPQKARQQIELEMKQNTASGEEAPMKLLGVINAGFFDAQSLGENSPNNSPEGNATRLFSFFQSAPPWLPRQKWQRSEEWGNMLPPHPSRQFRRPCFQWKGFGYRPEYVYPASDNWEGIKQNPSRNVFCAGPLLIRSGKSVWNDESFQGGFSPAARTTDQKKGDDPLSLKGTESRTASCLKSNGNMLFFASSPKPCGKSIPNLTKRLLDLGCIEAMAHDGGRSVQYEFHIPTSNAGVLKFSTLKLPGVFNALGLDQTPVPVWLAISIKPE